ncbi:hypothetical protein CCV26_004892 [Escherichia coli]|nr:hypothetical protein [Escherichia coli]EFF9497315.1 fimbria/pilus outer membrane usher protein [Escherichia coli]EFL6429204.1 hypothetical protein [Escherichia coli]HAV7528143.1 hypothetical protein [Escherichia coli]HAW0275761.1 hypothetical protein [Escherichia coli]
MQVAGYRYSTQGFYNLSDSAYSRMSDSLLRLMFPSVIGCVQTVSRHFVIQTPVTVCQTI